MQTHSITLKVGLILCTRRKKINFMQICTAVELTIRFGFCFCYSVGDKQTDTPSHGCRIFPNKLTIYSSFNWRQGAQCFILIQRFTLSYTAGALLCGLCIIPQTWFLAMLAAVINMYLECNTAILASIPQFDIEIKIFAAPTKQKNEQLARTINSL